ncbi:MAG: peptidoglycan-binding protein [Treponema sp.]|jgi:hypothetical protein|nr:peptidoglycan-binding protein [Treponema sp.]
MSCERILDKVYEYSGSGPDAMPLLTRIRIGLHLLVCPDCAQEVERFEVCRDILHSDFLPPAPGLEDTVMAMIAAEEGEIPEMEEAEFPGGFSTRGWIIAGLVMLVSLATAFFGLDFNKVALAAGMSFMIPVGITIGIALTCYGALFVGSHLKEFTERFGL